jgi:hypothetical protein
MRNNKISQVQFDATTKENRRPVSQAAIIPTTLKNQSKVLDVFESRRRAEGQAGLGFGHHLFAGARVAHFTSFAVLGMESTEASQLHGVATFGRSNNGVDHSVNSVTALSTGDASFVSDGFGEFRLVHEGSPRHSLLGTRSTITANGLSFDPAMKRDSDVSLQAYTGNSTHFR